MTEDLTPPPVSTFQAVLGLLKILKSKIRYTQCIKDKIYLTLPDYIQSNAKTCEKNLLLV